MGNICRSPLAEGLFQQKLLQLNLPITVGSAGLTAMVGHEADKRVRRLLLEKNGVDISAHRGQQVTKTLLFEADLILVMESFQKIIIEREETSCYGRVHCLGKWSNDEITDPYQATIKEVEQAFSLIEQGVSASIIL